MAGVEIRENIPQKGRGLFAGKDFDEEDVLFEEKPLVCAQFHWNAHFKYLGCDHCLRSLESAEEQAKRLLNNPDLEFPHPECCSVNKEPYVQCLQCHVWYCSTQCRDTALEQYHLTLCLGPNHTNPDHPLNKLIDLWKEIHHPPESCSIALILRMIATVKQAKDRPAVLQSFSRFCSATENQEEGLVHKLIGRNFEVQLEMVRHQLKEALYEEDLQQWYTPEGFRSLFALLGTNGQGVGTSTMSIWAKGCESLDVPEAEKEQLDKFIVWLYDMIGEVAGNFLDVEGSGLYALQSLCNHSCDPNAEVTCNIYNNSTVVVRALQHIKQGEEILISYLNPCELERSRHSRRKNLSENYIFNCDCRKCIDEADDPDVTSEEEMESECEDEEEEEAAAAAEAAEANNDDDMV